MSDKANGPSKAYENADFLASRNARALRILAEYMEPLSRFEHYSVDDTIVFMGSARIPAAKAVAAGAAASGVDALAPYYEAARELAHRLTEWSKALDVTERRFVVCTGAGPGIMEAANRGASEARGLNIGLGISLPHEQHENPWVSRELAFEFHYFFMRKFWFSYLAKAVVFFPGGFGTLDELFEVLTLLQTGKIRKRLPLVLFGAEFWNDIVDFDALVRHGTINAEDLDLFLRTDSVDTAFEFITRELLEYALENPGPAL
jgi:uncharacterized protein (TIGR00730 family)